MVGTVGAYVVKALKCWEWFSDCSEETEVAGCGCGVCGEEVGHRLLWAIFGGICHDHGERCSIVVSVVRI